MDTPKAALINEINVSDRDAYLKDLSRLDSHISDEYNWIGQRIQWLLVSNSFLLGSFITAYNFYAGKVRSDYDRVSLVYMGGVFLVGLISSVLVFLGVIAAQKMVADIKEQRDAVQLAYFKASASFPYQVRPMGTKTGSLRNFLGKAAGYCMPILLILLWLFLAVALVKTKVFMNNFWSFVFM